SQTSTADFPSRLDHPRPLAVVDALHLAQESQRMACPKFASPCHERAQILGQAAAAIPQSSIEEAASDSTVVSERVGQDSYIGAGGLADLGHRVDKRDLGREKRVRRCFGQLGGGRIGHDQRRALGNQLRIDLAEYMLSATKTLA